MNRHTFTSKHLVGVFVYMRAYVDIYVQKYTCIFIYVCIWEQIYHGEKPQRMTGYGFLYKLLLNIRGGVGMLPHSFSSPWPLCIQPWYVCICRCICTYRHTQLYTFWSIFVQNINKSLLSWTPGLHPCLLEDVYLFMLLM